MPLTKICRLCLNNCKNGKSLYDERGEKNLLYDIILDYFHPKILDLKKAKHLIAICTGCWQSIADFHSFQALIQVSQLKLILETDNVEALENIKTEEDSLSVKEDHNVLEEHADRLELTRFLGNQVHNNCDESIPMIMAEEETSQSVDINTYYNISEDIDHVRIAAETSFSKESQKQTDIVAQWRPTIKSLTAAETLRRALEDQTMDIVSSPKDESNIDQEIIVLKYHMNEEGIDGNHKTTEDNIGGLSFSLPSFINLEPEENSSRLPLLPISKESPEVDIRSLEEPAMDVEEININEETIVAKDHTNEGSIRDQQKTVDQNSRILSLSVENSIPYGDVESYVSPDHKESYSRKPVPSICKESPELDDRVAQWFPNSKCVAEADSRTVEDPTTDKEDINNNQEAIVAKFDFNEKNIRAFHLVCCNCKFCTKSKIKEHMLFHNDPDMFICQLCGKSFTSSYSLGCHKRAVHPEAETEKFKCHKCSTDFTTRGGLSFHYTRNHGALKRAQQMVQPDGTIVYACEDCNYSTKIYRCFQSHRWYAHSPRNSFVCHVCSKGFKKASLLHSHLAVHAGQIPFICKICTVGFRYRKLLQRHLQDKHPEEHRQPNKKKASSHDPQRDSKRLAQLYQCSLCLAKFTGRSNLKFHVKKKHARELKVSSKEFGEASTVLKSSNKEQTKPSLADNFATNIPLHLETPSASSQAESKDKTKKPKRKPSNVGRFKCALCKLRFLTSEHLKQHLIDGHRGQGIRKCLYCTKTFTSAKSLYGHSKNEHGDRVKQFNKKPTAFYKCPVCSMHFINRSNFELHCKIAHSLEVKNVKSILE